MDVKFRGVINIMGDGGLIIFNHKTFAKRQTLNIVLNNLINNLINVQKL